MILSIPDSLIYGFLAGASVALLIVWLIKNYRMVRKEKVRK
jgi:hypothetical protein